jgi:hypothetical protein
MLFQLKEGVDPSNIKGETIEAIIKTAACFNLLGSELTITSISDGKHMKGSKHYEGFAFDCRTWDFPVDSEKREVLLAFLDEALNWQLQEYDIVDEQDHIHIEFDPKDIVPF